MNFEQIKETNNSSAMPTYGRYDLGIASGKGSIAKDFDGLKRFFSIKVN